MIPLIIVHPVEFEVLQPYCRPPFTRNITDPQALADKINAIPDDVHEKALAVHQWHQLCAAAATGNRPAIEARMALVWLTAHAAGRLLPLATFGKTFKEHSQVKRAAGPIRRAIARELKKNCDLKNREVWAILTAKPPKGWTFYDNHAGKYVEGPKTKNMGYARFSEVCLQERNKLKS